MKRTAWLPAALAVAVVIAPAVTTPRAVARPSDPALPVPRAVAAPVTPEQAVAATEALALLAPPLPSDTAALLARRAPKPVPADLMARFERARAAMANGPNDHDPHKANGYGCEAQGFQKDGKPMIHETDLNHDGNIDLWEQDPNKNETCTTVMFVDYTPYYAPAEGDRSKGSFVAEFRTEYDAETKRTYKRSALRWNYIAEKHSHACAASDAEGNRALKLVADTKKALQKYVNNPAQLRLDGYWPYPVPGTKTFHWFKSELWTDKRADGSDRVLDPNAVEMFTMALTDDGYVPYNVAYIFQYHGDEKGGPKPTAYDANKHRMGNNNLGSGCLVFWHGHNGQADGTATGNLEGRDWMAHLNFYGGLFPFEGDYDCSESHGWFTPLNSVPALCNSEATGI